MPKGLKSAYRLREKGFSLLELALVLFIITLVLGGMLNPLSSLLEGRQRTDTRKELERIKEALVGFAMIKGYLPCPTTEPDPKSDNYGVADASCNDDSTDDEDGYLPWRTLGVQAVDPWGIPRTTAADPFNGYWRYRVDRNFSNAPFTMATKQGENIMIKDFQGHELTAKTQKPVAVIYSTGANLIADGENATFEPRRCGNASGYFDGSNPKCAYGWPLYQGGGAVGRAGSPVWGTGSEARFDDITVWLSRPLLLNRMVLSGRLP